MAKQANNLSVLLTGKNMKLLATMYLKKHMRDRSYAHRSCSKNNQCKLQEDMMKT